MQIVGEWFLCDDGTTRPVVRAEAAALGNKLIREYFLVDSCADISVISASLLGKLNLPTQAAPPGLSVEGISGATSFAVVATRLELPRDDGGPASIQGTFAAFTDSSATDLSILGRDVLDHFDVILSHRRKQILLLAGNHRYQVIGF